MAKKAKKTYKIEGIAGTTVDLDQLLKDSRTNGQLPLAVKIHEYDSSKGESPDPDSASIGVGDIWMSVDTASKTDK